MELIHIAGYVGKDAEIKESNGRSYTKFTIAVDKSYKTGDGTKVSKTNWWTIFSQNEKIAQHIKKGTYLSIMGEPSFSVYSNDRRETSVNLSVNLIKFSFGPNPNSGQDHPQASHAPAAGVHSSISPPPMAAAVNMDAGADDDLPF